MCRKAGAGDQGSGDDEAPQHKVDEEIERDNARQPLYPAFDQGAAGRQLPASQTLVHREFYEGAQDGSPKYGCAVARAGNRCRDEVAGTQAGSRYHQAGADVSDSEGRRFHRYPDISWFPAIVAGGRAKVAVCFNPVLMTCR